MEKFAFFNLLKALNTISAVTNANKGNFEEGKTQKIESTPPPAFLPNDEFNAMTQILVRHEKISNRVRNNK